MAKAYDRVEWAYSEKMLHKMEFPSRFIALVMKYVTSVSYSIFMNGKPHGVISPSRGIRQGNPISPYLFLISSEGLSSLLQRAEENFLIQGISITAGARMINHLLFADDSLIFCNASLEELNELRRMFLIYKNASGQHINFARSLVCFSCFIGFQTKMQIDQALGVPIVPCHKRYLGLPTVMGRDKKKMFRSLNDRIWKKINGWEGKLLSKAGKEVFIKVVCQSMPSYTMSVFKFPLPSCGKIESIFAQYWWTNRDSRGIHWRLGSNCARLKVLGASDFGKSQALIRPCYINKAGGYWNSLTPSLPGCSKLGTSKTQTSRKHKWDRTPPIYGDPWYGAESYYTMDLGGLLAMDRQFVYTMMLEC